jgi:hypothetical protein
VLHSCVLVCCGSTASSAVHRIGCRKAIRGLALLLVDALTGRLEDLYECAEQNVPTRKSTRSTATRMRICAVIWIIGPKTTRHSSMRDRASGAHQGDRRACPWRMDRRRQNLSLPRSSSSTRHRSLEPGWYQQRSRRGPLRQQCGLGPALTLNKTLHRDASKTL